MNAHTPNLFAWEESHPRTISENPYPIDLIPQPPTYEIRRAKGHETTFAIDPASVVAQKPFSWQGFRDKVPIIKQRAKADQRLVGPDMKYIPSMKENMLFRMDILKKAEKDRSYQGVLLEMCRSDIIFWINTFCFTFDPRLKRQKVPFILYPFQEEVITWQLGLLTNKQTGLIEKSREVGASWMFIAVGAWLILFHEGMVEYWMSLREEDVDNRELSSLLGKLRFILVNLPEWMRGGWVEGSQGYDMKMKVKIPETGSVVQGQLTRGTAGVSGRSSRVIVDEAALVEDMSRVVASLSSISDSKLFVSTPRGMSNHFYVMATAENANKKTLHWSAHPLKTDDWAKHTRAQIEYTDETWSQEQEIAYETSTMGRVFPEFTTFSGSEYEWKHVQVGAYYRYDPAYEVHVGMDFGIGYPTSVVFAQLKPPPTHFEDQTKHCLVIFDEEETTDLDVDSWARLLIQKGYNYATLVGDARTGNQRDAKNQTWFQYLKQHELDFKGKYSSEEATLIKMKRRLNAAGAMAVNAQNCPHTVKAFQNWSYALDKEGAIKSGAKPRHDQWSHKMKAALYLLDYMFDDTVMKLDQHYEAVPVQEWSTGRLRKKYL